MFTKDRKNLDFLFKVDPDIDVAGAGVCCPFTPLAGTFTDTHVGSTMPYISISKVP